jgi:hypothetical protein
MGAVHELLQAGGWLFAFIFVSIVLVVTVIAADALHERLNEMKVKIKLVHTGRH